MKAKYIFILLIILCGFLGSSYAIYNHYQSDKPTIKENPENTKLDIDTNEEEINVSKEENYTTEKYTLYLFHGATCPACLNAKEQINNDLMDIPNLEIISYEVWSHDENSLLMDKVAEKLGIEVNYIPFIVINRFNRVGYNKDDILNELKNDNKDIIKEVLKENPELNPVSEKLK